MSNPPEVGSGAARLSKSRLKARKLEVSNRITGLAKVMGTYHTQFRRLKNFSKDSWRNYLRNEDRVHRLSAMLSKHREAVRQRAARLRLLVDPPAPAVRVDDSPPPQ